MTILEDAMIANARKRAAPSPLPSFHVNLAQAPPPRMRLVHSVSLPDVRLEIHNDLAEVESEWRAFEKTAHCTVFQTFDWLSKWQRHIGEPRGVRAVIVFGRGLEDEILFIIPLGLET